MVNKIDKLALIAQMIDSAEKSIQSARSMLREVMGTGREGSSELVAKAQSIGATAVGGKIIEGVFDGQNMIGPDKKQYPVPANYASKSKLVEGDVLKLTIADDGSFIYKQIGPVERKKMLGLLTQDEDGQYRVAASGVSYKVLLASLTYFKAEPGDEVTVIIPKDGTAIWAAVENVIKQGQIVAGAGGSADQPMVAKKSMDQDEDLELE